MSESQVSSAESPAIPRVPVFSPGRIWVLTTSTFTQLVRMKTFYFLIVFAILVAGASNLNLLYTSAQKLRMLKDASFGAMSIFSWLFAIAATAVLIPRDLEDRTLYTILAKPVPRLEYLLGKLFGVLLTIGVALVVMQILFTGFLFFREVTVLAEERQSLEAQGMSAEDIRAQLELVRAQGVQWQLIYALIAIFLKASVVAAVTMLVSTFASSTLFTMIVATIVFVVGHFHKLAAGYWMHELSGSLVAKLVVKPIVMIIPDFRVFNVTENIVGGTPVDAGTMLTLAGLALLYVAVYSAVALYLFIDKEF
ncbi:MAG: ABC transporter permease subunit [Verrucomicrobiae bacterium]|nr:ABC transporter permease subunit [Verrucomicrobiae bacterium]